jgi:hypothetical protein
VIFFLRTRWNRHPLDRYLASWGRAFQSVVQPLDYDDLLGFPRLLPGVYVFADIELLDDAQRHRAAEVWDALHQMGSDVVLFNHPLRSLLRYDLLRTLHSGGINDFTVYRPDEDTTGLRFPAFIRGENDHNGFLSPPLTEPAQLATSLADLRQENPERPLLITEFCDTSSPDGVFRKYSAFLFNGEVIPRHVFFSQDWCQKGQDLVQDEFLEVEREYLETNPHEAQVREVFRLGHLDYGRIDYGMRNGRIQVWEINTNPMILSFQSYRQGRRIATHESFAHRIAGALRRLAETQPAARRDNYPGQRLAASIRYVREWTGVRWLMRHRIDQVRDHVTELVPRPRR